MSDTQELGLSAMYRIIKKSGGQRISEDAAEELRKVLEGLGMKIARQAVDLGNHAGRRTIKAGDIALASKNLNLQL